MNTGNQNIIVNNTKLVKFISHLIVYLFVLWCIFPIFWILLTSFKNNIDIMAFPPLLIFKATLQNFVNVFNSKSFGMAYYNTAVISVISVSIAIIAGMPAAYAIDRFRFRGRAAVNIWVLATRFMPPMVLILPFYQLYNKIGLRDTYAGLIIIYISIILPFIIWVLYGFVTDISIEIEEAATIDGAHPFRIFFSIIIPLLAPGLVATGILCLITTWNELLFVMILAGSRVVTLPLEIMNTVKYDEIAWGNLAGITILSVMPVFVFTIFIQKYLVTGLTFGSIK